MPLNADTIDRCHDNERKDNNETNVEPSRRSNPSDSENRDVKHPVKLSEANVNAHDQQSNIRSDRESDPGREQQALSEAMIKTWLDDRDDWFNSWLCSGG